MTTEQKIELLQYVAQEFERIEAEANSVKVKFDSSINFPSELGALCDLKYLQGQLETLNDIVKRFSLRQPFTISFSLN